MRKLNATERQSMLGGAMVLTISMAMVKVIGLVFKLPLANIIGMTGRGYFNNAYEIYTPIYAIAITGLPIAVARMVSQRMTLGLYNDIKEIHSIARRLFLLTGLAGTLLMLGIAYPFAHNISVGGMNALPSMLAIAPSIFFCCAMSSYRGYYEGLRNMIPTALSQVIEAILKMVVGLALAFLVMGIGARWGYEESQLWPWAAAAAILGITAGSIVGLIYLWVRHKFKGDDITRSMLLGAPKAPSRKQLLREMINVAIPMVISSSILALTNVIDTINVNYLLDRVVKNHLADIKNIYYADVFTKDYASWIWGMYSNTLDFRTLIPTIVTALGVSALPAISAAWTARNKDTVQKNINQVLRTAMMIGLPAGFGMAVLSKEIMLLFYEKSNPGNAAHAGPIIMWFGIFTALMAVSTPIISMLQGVGRAKVSAYSVVAGVLVKIGVNMLLVSRPEINVQGAVWGTILFYVVIVCVNLTVLLHVTKTKVKIVSVLIKPLFCAVLSAGGAYLVNSLAQRFLPRFISSSSMLLLLAVVAAIGTAVVIYAVSMLLTHAISEIDLEILPGGKKIGKVLTKHGLLASSK